MHRTNSFTLVALVLAVIACSADGVNQSCDGSTEVEAGTTPPNVIVVLTDDQTVEQVRVMPTVLERLASEGVVFVNSVVNYSNCCPSRATLLTGQHAKHHGVLWNTPPTGGFSSFADQETTLPVALQRAGYETIMIGKYLNRFGERDPEDRVVPPGWTDFKALIFPAESVYREPAFFDNGDVVEHSKDSYTTTVITEYAIDAIGRLAREPAPFFMLLGHVAPHGASGIPLRAVLPGQLDAQIAANFREFLTPPLPEHKYANRFAEESLPRTSSFNEADVSDKPIQLQRRRLDGVTIREMTLNYRGELASLLSVDDSVAAVLDELDRHCVAENTFVIYTSDNGFFHGEHRFAGGKYFAYEPSIRVPLIIRGPGVEPGVQPSLVSNVDLAPTIAELAGASLLREADGKSLAGILRAGPSQTWGRAVYLEGHSPTPNEQRPPFEGVHTGNSVYVEYPSGSAEYYDLQTDPAQLENRVGDSAIAEEVARHGRLLASLRECAGPACASIGDDLPVAGEPDVAWLPLSNL